MRRKKDREKRQEIDLYDVETSIVLDDLSLLSCIAEEIDEKSIRSKAKNLRQLVDSDYYGD